MVGVEYVILRGVCLIIVCWEWYGCWRFEVFIVVILGLWCLVI